MRLPFAAGLLALLAALAGCGAGTHPDDRSPEQQQHDAVASHFHAQEENRKGAPDRLPLQFTDLDGNAVDLTSFRDRSNVLLVVVKGLPKNFGGKFCPGCLAQVNALAANHDKFAAEQTEVLMLFPGPTDAVPEFLRQGLVDGSGGLALPFRLLRDTDLAAVTALGIDGDWARPATYILDKRGRVVFAFVGETTADRPSVPSLLERLRKLNAAPR